MMGTRSRGEQTYQTELRPVDTFNILEDGGLVGHGLEQSFK
jgi:hypothetical protein